MGLNNYAAGKPDRGNVSPRQDARIWGSKFKANFTRGNAHKALEVGGVCSHEEWTGYHTHEQCQVSNISTRRIVKLSFETSRL